MKDCKKIVNVFNLTIIISLIVVICLIYFGRDYYYQARLIFESDQFLFFCLFFCLVLWMFIFLAYQGTQLKKDNVIIKELLQMILQENYLTQDNLEKLHRNTRQLIMSEISKRKG